jgi:hypothetical protein
MQILKERKKEMNIDGSSFFFKLKAYARGA